MVVALVAAVVAAIVMAAHSGDDAGPGDLDASATTAIQGYLDALTKGDDETVARNNSCGFFDAVTDRQSDMTLANLSQRRLPQAVPATRGRDDRQDRDVVAGSVAGALHHARHPGGRNQGEVERQGIAQLLVQDKKILVCSYLPRNTGQF